MGAELDEQRLRQVLDAVTADQPPAPPGRHDDIRRRAARRHRNLIAGPLALLAVAAAAAGIGLSPVGSQPASGSRQVPNWALPWPDHRNGSVPQRVLDRAVIAWRHTDPADVIPPSRVIWYAGQTVADGREVVAVFETATPRGNRLVVAKADAASVMHGQPAWSDSTSPWATYTVRAPSPRQQTLAIGLYVPQFIGSGQVDNWIAELTAPSMHSLVIQVPGVTEQSVAVAGTTGLLIRDVGQVTGQVRVGPQPGQPASKVRLDNMSLVGLPGSPASEVPALAWPAPLTKPDVFEGNGQGGGRYAAVTYMLGHGSDVRARLIIARCYGPAPLRIAINSRTIGSITCDNAQHELRLTGSLQVNLLNLYTSRLTSYRVGLSRR